MNHDIIFDPVDLFKAYCKLHNKHGLLISSPPSDIDQMDEIKKAAPYLERGDLVFFAVNGEAFLFFDSAEECYEHFCMTVGDDGPTNLNAYDGPLRIYALTCDNQGNLMAENT